MLQQEVIIVLFIIREFYNDLKYCEDEPHKIGEVFVQSVGTLVLVFSHFFLLKWIFGNLRVLGSILPSPFGHD